MGIVPIQQLFPKLKNSRRKWNSQMGTCLGRASPSSYLETNYDCKMHLPCQVDAQEDTRSPCNSQNDRLYLFRTSSNSLIHPWINEIWAECCLKRAPCPNTEDWISHVIRIGQIRNHEKWPVFGLIWTPSNIGVSQVQLLAWLGSLVRVLGEEDPSHPTWVAEDNQHNSVQRLSRDMGCVSRWVHVIQLTNWSSSRLSVCPAHPPLRSWINKHCRWILVVVILAVEDWESSKTLKVKVIAEVAWEWARRRRCQAMGGVHRRRQSRGARRPSSWGRSSPSCSSSSASASAPLSR